MKMIGYLSIIPLLLVPLTMLYCEYVHYYLVLSQCDWPNLKHNSEPYIHLLAIADPHLLGTRNGHWFDKLRREWQMHRTFMAAIQLHHPDAVVFLGDLFDEGKWSSEEEFNETVNRFHQIFPVPSDVRSIIAVGNHDIGFHYSATPSKVKRFNQAFSTESVQVHVIRDIPFVTLNSMAFHGDDCSLCKSARSKLDKIANEFRCLAYNHFDCDHTSLDMFQYVRPILLQHYPMYRKSDSHCNEVDEAPSNIKQNIFKEQWDCLSQSSSRLIFHQLRPRLILSGHTHHGCTTSHYIKKEVDGTTDRQVVVEHSVSSFSWRNKVNPAFLMLSISRDEIETFKCQMPVETTIFNVYFVTLLLILFYVVLVIFHHFQRRSSRKPLHHD